MIDELLQALGDKLHLAISVKARPSFKTLSHFVPEWASNYPSIFTVRVIEPLEDPTGEKWEAAIVAVSINAHGRVFVMVGMPFGDTSEAYNIADPEWLTHVSKIVLPLICDSDPGPLLLGE